MDVTPPHVQQPVGNRHAAKCFFLDARALSRPVRWRNGAQPSGGAALFTTRAAIDAACRFAYGEKSAFKCLPPLDKTDVMLRTQAMFLRSLLRWQVQDALRATLTTTEIDIRAAGMPVTGCLETSSTPEDTECLQMRAKGTIQCSATPSRAERWSPGIIGSRHAEVVEWAIHGVHPSFTPTFTQTLCHYADYCLSLDELLRSRRVIDVWITDSEMTHSAHFNISFEKCRDSMGLEYPELADMNAPNTTSPIVRYV